MGNAGSDRAHIKSNIFKERPVKTFSVYFSGTDGTIVGGHTQITLFFNLTDAFDLTGYLDEIPLDGSHYKIAFDGCYVTNGTLGAIFAQGLTDQCQKVSKIVHHLIDSGYKVQLNCMGLSRGGMAILLLVKGFCHIPKIHLEMNTLLFDPVPGNLIISGKLDWFNTTLVNQCMDISESINLRRVLAIYPYQPLPDLTFHAPIIPTYPTHCEVTEDVTLGCHQGALFFPVNLETRLSFLRIKTFLLQCGTVFDESLNQLYPIPELYCLREIEEECLLDIPSTRNAHSQTNAVIVRESTGEYLNLFHYELRQELGLEVTQDPKFILKIRR